MGKMGERVDRAVGLLSHVLHGLRGAERNTVDDLGPYIATPLGTMFPRPVVPRDVVRSKPRVNLGEWVTETLRWHSQHVPLCPHYRARHAGAYWKNQRVTARWIHPKKGARDRALVYVHGWLEPGPWVEEATLLPKLRDDLGIDVLHVQLPFHGSRNPKAALFHGEFFWSADLVRSLEAVRQSVIDVQTLLAWLKDPAGGGYREVGVAGISLGGSITMVLACLEPPPDYIIPIIAHLQLAEAVEEAPILWRMKADLERFGIDAARRKQIFEGIGLGRLRPVLAKERQLWIAAEEDAYITRPLVTRQWKDWGEPPIEWIAGGHMTFALSLAKIMTRIKAFHAGLDAARAG